MQQRQEEDEEEEAVQERQATLSVNCWSVTQSARNREGGGPDGIKDNGGGSLQNDKTLNGFE